MSRKLNRVLAVGLILALGGTAVGGDFKVNVYVNLGYGGRSPRYVASRWRPARQIVCVPHVYTPQVTCFPVSYRWARPRGYRRVTLLPPGQSRIRVTRTIYAADRAGPGHPPFVKYRRPRVVEVVPRRVVRSRRRHHR